MNAARAGRRHEVLAIFTATIAGLLLLALGSYQPDEGGNLAGALGKELSRVLVSAFGAASFLLPFELLLATRRLFVGRPNLLGAATVASTLVLTFCACAMVQLVLPESIIFAEHSASGIIGQVLGEVLRALLGTPGAFLVAVAVVLITLVLRTPLSVAEILERISSLVRYAVANVLAFFRAIALAWEEAKALDRAELESKKKLEEPKIVAHASSAGELVAERIAPPAAPAFVLDDEPDEPLDELDEEEPPQKRAPRRDEGPTIVAPKQTQLKAASTGRAHGPFELPSTALLAEGDAHTIQVDAATLRENAVRLTKTLADYGVKGRVDEIHPGPVVTMYEFEPQSGTKVSKVAGLADDIAMALAAQKVRIVAPIPGKSRVGFELPNEQRATVFMRTVLEDQRWETHKGALPIALGQDISGQPVYADLAKMPHLLVAGATGAGKSVGLNVMLSSLLYKRSPEEVRLLMIDPKVVELKVYDDIPHMLLPVVTDMNKASLALRWAVDEMERRYQLFADGGTRDITSYNKKVEKVRSGELAIEKLVPGRVGKVRAQGAEGETLFLDPSDGEPADELEPPKKLPYIVVVVDEFADLMMVAAKDAEASIARLAQKARAAGIHVILATQRPSVDVITGVIKANFPSRMAFKVSQREDSKTILGRQGAEHLLGMGDMLFLPPGSSDLTRVHSAFISEDEVHAVCDHLRAQGDPEYDENITRPRDEDDGGFDGPSSDDPIYDKAVRVVADAGYCSISHIQRQLSVGYNKAAKLVERMEKEGVVGPPSGKAGGRREVLVSGL
jgi:DNA segregation ATPase FtsK/SpoIIIE, S-DNA-T family